MSTTAHFPSERALLEAMLLDKFRFGVILRKVWGGSRTWAGARAQAVLMSVWRTCWQQGRSALDFLGHLLRGTPGALALPP
jgi:transposase